MNDASFSGDRRERKKEQTRSIIIAKALQLFTDQGYETTTMEQIAAEADIAKATLYNYFPNKEAIVSGFMQDTVRKSEPEIQRLISRRHDTRSRLLALLSGIQQWIEANRDIVRMHTSIKFNELVTSPAGQMQRGSNFEQVLARILLVGRETGEIRTDLPVETMALYLKVMYLVPFVSWLTAPETTDLDNQFAEMVDLFLGGAGTSKEAGNDRD